MNISINQNRRTSRPEKSYTERFEAYTKEVEARDQGDTFRAVAGTTVGALSLGVAGDYLGSLTGGWGRAAGAVLGVTAGAVVGGAAGLAANAGKGPEAPVYGAMVAAVGAVAGGIAGGYFGVDGIGLASSLAGGVTGAAIGFGAQQYYEYAQDSKIAEKYNL